MASSTVALFVWAVNGFLDWIREWIMVQPSTKINISPPSAIEHNKSADLLARVGLLVSLLLAAVGNIVHFMLTAEIISVIFRNRFLINHRVAQALGWIILDTDTVSEGTITRSSLGITLLLILTLPTVITALTWLPVIVSKILKKRTSTKTTVAMQVKYHFLKVKL